MASFNAMFDRISSSTSSRLSEANSRLQEEIDAHQNEINTRQKLLLFNNLSKIDQQFNAGTLGIINSLQDNEINEVIMSVDNFISLCLQSIDKNDHIIDLSYNLEIDTPGIGKSKKSTNCTQSEYQTLNEQSITIDRMIQTDFLRNGLKTGPLLTQKETPEEISDAKNLKNNKPNGETVPTLVSYLNYKSLVGNRSQILFKYYLVLDLNPDYFEFVKMNKIQPLYSVKLIAKPPNWSISDLDQFTLDIKLPNDKEQFKKSLPTIRNTNQAKKNVPSYLPRRVKSVRYLNSKSLFDRIYKHFLRVLNLEWIQLAASSEQTKGFDKQSSCDLKDNQMRVKFKWKGIKQKDLDVIIVIDMALKFTDRLIEKQILTAMIQTANSFLQCGGVFADVPLINENTMQFISRWMLRNLSCDLNSIYLLPNCIHYWSLNIQQVKQNFLRFLCWINNFSEKSVEANIVLDLLKGVDNSTSTQLRLFFANQLQRQSQNTGKLNFSLILANCSQGCLFLITRLLQIFNYLSLSKQYLTEKVGNLTQSEDNIIADILFSEINRNYLTSRKIWCPENMFDMFWSALMKIRYSIIKCLIPDSFGIFENVLPIEYLQFIGMQSFNLIPYLNTKQNGSISSKSEYYITSKQFEDNEINKVIENAMKLVLTGIAPDEKEKEIQPVPTKSQTNMTDITQRPMKKPNGLSNEATIASEHELTSSVMML